MLDDLIDQLHDDDPARRRQAIVALGKSKDPAALRALAEVYRSDPEVELRDLARKAGVYIRKQMDAEPLPDPDMEDDSYTRRRMRKLEEERDAAARGEPIRSKPAAAPQAPQVSQPKPEQESYTQRRMRALEESRRAALETTPTDALPVPDPVAGSRRPIRGRKYNVPKENQERARKYVDAALSDNLNGDNSKAMKNLTEALSLDPNLVNDAYFNSIASTVTNLDGDAAIDMIVDRGQRKQFEQNAQQQVKQAKIDKHLTVAHNTTWTDAIWELVIYMLISVFGPVFSGLVATQLAQNYFNSLAPDVATQSAPLALQNTLLSFTTATLIPIGFISGIVGVAGLFIQLFLVHVMATVLFGGHGTMRHLLATLLGFYNRWLPVLFLLIYLSTAVYFVSAGSPISACFVIIFVILTLFVLFNTSNKIGTAYDFGGLKGCLSFNLTNLLIIGIVTVVMALILQTLGATALETFFRLNPVLTPGLTPVPPA